MHIFIVSCKESPSSNRALLPGGFCTRELQPHDPEQIPGDASRPFSKFQILYRHHSPKGKGIAPRVINIKARLAAGPVVLASLGIGICWEMSPLPIPGQLLELGFALKNSTSFIKKLILRPECSAGSGLTFEHRQ